MLISLLGSLCYVSQNRLLHIATLEFTHRIRGKGGTFPSINRWCIVNEICLKIPNLCPVRIHETKEVYPEQFRFGSYSPLLHSGASQLKVIVFFCL
jgi:hypothetical protein